MDMDAVVACSRHHTYEQCNTEVESGSVEIIFSQQ